MSPRIPEFLREGKAVSDFLNPDRVVIGTNSERVGKQVKSLYGSLEATVADHGSVSAEVVKYASNAFLAAKITFANAIAMLCDAVGADVRHVTRGMGHDHRIGSSSSTPARAGVDRAFPRTRSPRADRRARRLRLRAPPQRDRNERQAIRTCARHGHLGLAGGSVDGKVVAVWGLTFKANTDDLRCSPALKIIEGLVAAGARVRAYDPAISHPIDDIEICADPYTSACRQRAPSWSC